MKELRMIKADKVRRMCIQGNYYTCGTCEEYNEMFNLCETMNPTTDIYQVIANNIIEHSDIEEIALMTGLTKHEMVKSVMWELINDCTTVYILDDNEDF